MKKRRFILGMMNGITPALRTTVHEVCGGSEHGVQAMAYIDGEIPSFQQPGFQKNVGCERAFRKESRSVPPQQYRGILSICFICLRWQLPFHQKMKNSTPNTAGFRHSKLLRFSSRHHCIRVGNRWAFGSTGRALPEPFFGVRPVRKVRCSSSCCWRALTPDRPSTRRA